MTKRYLVALASVVVLLVFTGGALAQSPASTQYAGGDVSPGGGGGVTQAGSGGLPFTGFDAALVALAGAGLAASGVVLRRTARAKSH